MHGREDAPSKRGWFGLLEAFLLLIAFLFLVDTVLQYAVSSSQAAKASEEVLAQASFAIEQKIDEMRRAAEFLLLQSKGAAGRNRLDFGAPEDANPFFMEYMKANPYITSVNYGDSAGNGYLILFADGRWKNRVKSGSEKGTVRWLLLDEGGKVVSLQRRDDDYDPRSRPWYKAAAGEDGIHWSAPYVFRTTRDVGITASTAIGPLPDQPVRVVGADVMLKDLSEYLAALKRGKGDLSITLVSRDGDILATSETAGFREVLRGGGDRLPRVGDRGFEVLSKGFHAAGDGGNHFLSFDSSGTAFYLLQRPFRFSHDIECRMILTIPKESLLAYFGTWNRIRLGIFLALVAASGIFFTMRYLSPLRKLARAVRSFGTHEYVPPPPTGRNDEIGLLVSDFRRMAEDLTARQEELAAAAKALGRASEEWRNTFDSMTDFVSVHGRDCRIVKANRAMAAFFGTEPGELAGRKCHDVFLRSAEPCPGCSFATSSGMETPFSTEIETPGGVPLMVSMSPLRDESENVTGFVHIARDLTERKKLESQLILSRKMEAVGKLAGGIAHDFNNLLTAILGYSEFLDGRFPEGDPSKREIGEIRKAAERAASLTRQLLAFSRKQILQPRVISINAVVAEMEAMLRRLIGEDIDLVTRLEEDPWRVKADPGQVSQVVMNLAINARDAMPGGGRLTIETANVSPGAEAAFGGETMEPGGYVLLSVGDTGAGMSRETMERIFDPFFTTKGTGKGTGLGLATVYGIVKQSRGHIRVDSEPGKGSTFRVFFPRTDEHEEPVRRTTHEAPFSRGIGTVLIVDDDGGIRRLASEHLERAGYRVLQAADGEEALRIADGFDGEIALVVTDVVMPKMGGKALFDRIRIRRPGIKVLYMSGYTDNAIVHHGVLEEGTAFLQKPFTTGTLSEKIREVLGIPGGSAPGR
ncbi:MAG: hypothetical protein OHK0028_08140 [Deltaproteobacteria bacterium]